MTKTKNNTWKPEYKYESISGTFEDYRGNERDFTMVAVSIPVDEDGVIVTRPVEYEDMYEIPAKNVLNKETGEIEYVPAITEKYIDTYDETLAPISKMLSVGVAVRCVRDKDRGLGERIAYGKAVTLLTHTLYVSHSGMINTKMVKALLEQEADHFRKDPGSYLIGYNNDKKRYETTGKVADAEKTTEELKASKKPTNKSKAITSIKDKMLAEANSSSLSNDNNYV